MINYKKKKKKKNIEIQKSPTTELTGPAKLHAVWN